MCVGIWSRNRNLYSRCDDPSNCLYNHGTIRRSKSLGSRNWWACIRANLLHSYMGFYSHYRMLWLLHSLICFKHLIHRHMLRLVIRLFMVKVTSLTIIIIWLITFLFLTQLRGNLWLCVQCIFGVVLMRCGSGDVLRIRYLFINTVWNLTLDAWMRRHW